jgi:hypothetical protein
MLISKFMSTRFQELGKRVVTIDLHCDKRGGVEEVFAFRFVLGEIFGKGI